MSVIIFILGIHSIQTFSDPPVSSALKICVAYSQFSHFTLLQITFSLLFALVIAFVSDGLGTVPDKASVLSSDTSFRHEFHALVRWNMNTVFCVPIVYYRFGINLECCWHPFMLKVMATGNDPIVEGFTGGIRLAWVVHLMLIQDVVAARETVSSGSSNEMGYLSQCLEVIFSNNVFQFLLDKVLRTAAYQVHLPCYIFFLFSDKNKFTGRENKVTMLWGTLEDMRFPIR